uniref:Subtilisin-like protease SBT3.9 n=1 Tax=Elaeis guineensis var. tenera TaxID=51953 RepID=A0A8N4IB59_ELAGV|nr:subtilisin-like protease SBT3.9 [Elaeis guineensis]
MPYGAEATKKLYIVYMGERKHEDPQHVTASHNDMLTSLLESKEEALASIVYSYRHGFSGFAAMLTESQAKLLAETHPESPEVISIRPSRNYQLHTTRSWNFLGLNNVHPTELLRKSNFGDGVIIGIIDTGIWPESKSFNDDGYGPTPSRWKGICQVGEAFDANNCSRKIIGARYYTAGISDRNRKLDFMSPRDAYGHGTHTASTAAGSIVENVSFHGLGAGVARGGAPRARLAIYKALWNGGGNTATVLKAIDDAIHDGVDILSLSIRVLEESFGTLHAVARGITVVYSAGNDGPVPQTLSNTAPWVITVAASTIDRSFPTVITLGDHRSFVGQSIFYNTTKGTNYKALAFGGSCNEESLNGTDLAGTIVLCVVFSVSSDYSLYQDALKGVLKAGGEGIIMATYTNNFLEMTEECKGITCVFVDFVIAHQIGMYIGSESAPVASVKRTSNVIGKEVLAPKVATFSSRGPSVLDPGVLKPDIAAPGVSILAAKKNSYAFLSGTSMACPHVAGVAALLKSMHPNWSHAAIKSALVTTASTTDQHGMPIQAEGLPRKIADPFDYGGGHIDPNRAADPGLIYDIDPKDYFKFFNCTLQTFEMCDTKLQHVSYLNLPSISIPNLKSSLTVWRTVTNVGEVDAVYKAIPEPPPGVQMVVEPSILVFNAVNKAHTFKITFKPTSKVQGDYTFGSLTWWDGGVHSVKIPIAVRIVIRDLYADIA